MQLLSAGNIIKQAWDQFSKHFKDFREPVVWMLVPAVISGLLPIIPGTTDGTSLLLGIISTVITLWASVQIIDIAWALHEGKAPASALTKSLAWGSVGRIVDYTLVSILYAVVVMAGFFLVIIPGVIFANWFAFAPLVTLIEGAHGTGSLKRSKDLVEGRFWPIAWRWIVINVVPSLALLSVIVVLLGVISVVTGTFDLMFAGDKSVWWGDLIVNAVSVLAMPYFLIASVILFAEARKTQ